MELNIKADDIFTYMELTLVNLVFAVGAQCVSVQKKNKHVEKTTLVITLVTKSVDQHPNND